MSFVFSAIDWEAFTIGEDHYLVVSNTQDSGNVGKDRAVVYRWQGLEKFMPVHWLDILPSADFEVLTVGEDTYLAYANAKNGISQVLKVKYV